MLRNSFLLHQVKILSAELGMDRADVLSFLRNPPPELLLMSDELENEVAEASERAEAKVEKAPKVAAASRKQPAPPLNPSGGPQSPRSWHGSKRLKKEHIATFERVYRNSTRPSVNTSDFSDLFTIFQYSLN